MRYTPRAFRKWSVFRVANTAFGAVSFLALEAIGGAMALTYGFWNALWAILAVSAIIFLTGLPISYYAARHGLDMDLLTRGAGFGYLGSTLTSLIYASFTSAPDMAQQLYPIFPARLLTRYRYDTRSSLAKLTCPVLIMHSPEDEIIPFSHGQVLYTAAHEPKRLLELRGGHNDALLVSRDLYARGVTEFLDGLR